MGRSVWLCRDLAAGFGKANSFAWLDPRRPRKWTKLGFRDVAVRIREGLGGSRCLGRCSCLRLARVDFFYWCICAARAFSPCPCALGHQHPCRCQVGLGSSFHSQHTYSSVLLVPTTSVLCPLRLGTVSQNGLALQATPFLHFSILEVELVRKISPGLPGMEAGRPGPNSKKTKMCF